MPAQQEQELIDFGKSFLSEPESPQVQTESNISELIDVGNAFLKDEPIEKSLEVRLQERRAISQTESDQLFQDARETEINTDAITTQPLKRHNQIRREHNLPPVRELPEELLGGRTISNLRGAISEFANIANRAVEGVADTVSALSELAGLDTFEEITGIPFGTKDVNEFFAASRNVIRAYLPDDPRLRDEYLSQLSRGVGGAVGFIAAELAGGPLLLAGLALGSGAQEQAEAARAAGADETAKAIATVLGLGLGATDIIPGARYARALKPIDRVLKGRFFNAILNKGGVLVDVVTEGLQEFAQEAGSNVIAKQILKQDRDLFDGTFEAGGVGAGTGGVVGTISRLLGRIAGIKIRIPRSAAKPKKTKGQLFAKDKPEAAERLRKSAVAAKKEKGKQGVPSKQDFAAEGLPDLSRKERAAFVKELSEVEEAPPVEPVKAEKKEAKPTEKKPTAKKEVTPKKKAAVVSETMFPEAKKIQEQTKEAPGGLAAIPKVFRPGLAADRNDKGADYWPSKEVESRVEKARGIKRTTFGSKLKGFVKESYAKITRPQEFLPKTKLFASANEGFRQLKNIPSFVEDQVIRRVGSLVNALSSSDMKLFSDKVIIDNQLASLERNEPLRFGFDSQEQVEETQKRIDEKVSESPAVIDALESRKLLNRELVEKLVENKVIPETALKNVDAYFHQQVLSYVAGVELFGGKPGVRQKKKGFQKARVKGDVLDESFDYNTSFIEAEVRWQVDALTKIKTDQVAKDFFKDVYDVKDVLVTQAKEKNFEKLVGGPENVARIDQLRGTLEQARVGTIELDGDEKAVLNKELSRLDPTRPFRRKIAEGLSAVGTSEDVEGIDFKMISDLAETDYAEGHPDFQRAIGARKVLKAIGDRSKFIKEKLGKEFLEWSDLIPEGHTVWQPEPGNRFYQAYSLQQRIAEALEKDALESAEITKDQIRMVLAIGGPRTQWVIPEPIANQLDKLERKIDVGLVGRASKAALRGWKIYTLLNPKRAISYMTRNVTGDVDPVLGGAPGIAFEMKDSIRDLAGVYKKEISVPDDVITAIDLGVIGSSMTDVEIPELKNKEIFQRFYETKFDPLGVPARVLETYFDTVKNFNEYRENSLRMAAFRYYRKKLKSGTLIHYGGARKAVVDELVRQQGVDVAAAHLSRNLLGDYGDLTVLGEWLRSRLIPFWSWQEINLKRYPRLAINSVQAKKLKAATGSVAMGIYRGLLLSRLATLYATMWAYNNLMQPDKEDDLDTYDRQNPHITLCRNQDGSVRIFRNVGALGDLLEWLGINTLLALTPKFNNGQITGADLFKEVVKDPINKVVQGVNPLYKLAVEVPFSISVFPDVFNPRYQDRGEAIAGTFALRDEYRAAKGQLLKDGSRARPNYTQRLFVGVVDPKLTSLNKMYELRGDFLRSKGKDVPTILAASKFRNMKLAAVYENFDAFLEARKKYISEGKGFRNFMASLRNLDPISARLNDADEEEFEQEFLVGTQKNDLTVARDYAKTLEVYLWNWWMEASKIQDTPQQQRQLKKDVKNHLESLKTRATLTRTIRKRDESRQEFRARKVAKKKKVASARERLRRRLGK